jgi:predicted amidophosphoribosyltransferase
MQTVRTINLPGRHCPCGALRASNNGRCEKCQARAGWYRHNCRRPRRPASQRPRVGMHANAEIPARGRRSAGEG